MTQFTIFIASPGDVKAERKVVLKVIEEINIDEAKEIDGVKIILKRWEDVPAGIHEKGPQAWIDYWLQLGRQDLDLFIGIFWRRYGSEVYDAKSGTRHEYDMAYKNFLGHGRPQVALYFNEQPFYPQSIEESNQMTLVLEFKKETEALYFPFDNPEVFKNKVKRDILDHINSHKEREIRIPFPLPKNTRDKVIYVEHFDRLSDKLPNSNWDRIFQLRGAYGTGKTTLVNNVLSSIIDKKRLSPKNISTYGIIYVCPRWGQLLTNLYKGLYKCLYGELSDIYTANSKASNTKMRQIREIVKELSDMGKAIIIWIDAINYYDKSEIDKKLTDLISDTQNDKVNYVITSTFSSGEIDAFFPQGGYELIELDAHHRYGDILRIISDSISRGNDIDFDNPELLAFLQDTNANLYMIRALIRYIKDLKLKNKDKDSIVEILNDKNRIKKSLYKNYYPNSEEQKILHLLRILNIELNSPVTQVELEDICAQFKIKCDYKAAIEKFKILCVYEDEGYNTNDSVNNRYTDSLLYVMHNYRDFLKNIKKKDETKIKKDLAEYFMKKFDEIVKSEDVTASILDYFPLKAHKIYKNINFYDSAEEVLSKIESDYLFPAGEIERILNNRIELVDKKLSELHLMRTYASLGSVYNHLSDYDTAINYFKKSKRIAKRLANQFALSNIYGSLGQCYCNQGKDKIGMAYFEAAVRYSQDPSMRVKHYCGIIAVFSFNGQYGIAKQYYDEKINDNSWYRAHDLHTEVFVDQTIGTLHSYMGKPDEATKRYKTALNNAVKCKQIGMKVFVQINQGMSCIDLGSFDEADQALSDALMISQSIYAEKRIAKASAHLGILAALRSDWERASGLLNDALISSDKHGYFDVKSLCHIYLSLYHLQLADIGRALPHAGWACKCAVPQHPEYITLGIAYLRDQQPDKAYNAFKEAETHSGILLNKYDKNYLALEMKGLAYAGMALCRPNDPNLIIDAKTAFQAARKVTSHAGIIKKLLLFRDAMRPADINGILEEVWASMEAVPRTNANQA